jgi:hypothetical protein
MYWTSVGNTWISRFVLDPTACMGAKAATGSTSTAPRTSTSAATAAATTAPAPTGGCYSYRNYGTTYSAVETDTSPAPVRGASVVVLLCCVSSSLSLKRLTHNVQRLGLSFNTSVAGCLLGVRFLLVGGTPAKAASIVVEVGHHRVAFAQSRSLSAPTGLFERVCYARQCHRHACVRQWLGLRHLWPGRAPGTRHDRHDRLHCLPQQSAATPVCGQRVRVAHRQRWLDVPQQLVPVSAQRDRVPVISANGAWGVLSALVPSL